MLGDVAAPATDVRVERIAGAAHWVHADAREQVNGLLLHFLQTP